ncbi:Pescadillo-like protein [Perkinsela sp. CCAP 1560/4]|nr:Pescadillo-like protein [Perkinsela sp. CCAP 1560/4]|eukprot:KNH01799.1 Pescadillo-like protein [Perkinsela sp. CCAP 1560/4]
MPVAQTKKTKEKRFKRRYLSKSQAKRYLQLDNNEFKRILIFKGIYPRVPKKLLNSQAKGKIYYATKEIKKIHDDPIIEKFREYQTHMKAYKSIEGTGKAAPIPDKPSYDLSATILGRYPTFAAALADVNDALSMVFLYAILPPAIYADTTIEGHAYLTTSMHEECKQIAKRWRTLVEKKRALRKGFISIKGYYYEAVFHEYGGRSVMWVDPHNFASSKPSKAIEHRIMLSYLEFYLSLLKFVCFKLENDMALREAENRDEVLASANSEPPRNRVARQIESLDAFERLKFYISREANPVHVGFVLANLGCEISSTYDAPDITHYVTDRPSVPFNEQKLQHVDYVQPQYVFDCLNQRSVLPVSGYGIGERCPPHRSPFVVEDTEDVPMEDVQEELGSGLEPSAQPVVVSDDSGSEEDEIREAPYRTHAVAKKVNAQLNFSNSMRTPKAAAHHQSDENFGLAQAANVSKKLRGLYTVAKHSHKAAVEKKRGLQVKRTKIQQGVLGISPCGKFLQQKKQ